MEAAQKLESSSEPAARRLARMAAVQGLYRLHLTDTTPDEVIREFRRDPHVLLNDAGGGDEVLPQGMVDQSLFGSIIGGVPANAPQLDEMIAGAMDAKFRRPGWKCCYEPFCVPAPMNY